MKTFLLALLAIAFTTVLKAQQSPRDEYDVFAKFPQNQGDFSDYIFKQARQAIVVKKDEKGTIKITIVIDSIGKASVFKISSNLSGATDSAFVKAIVAAPAWLPAKFHVHATSCYFTLIYDIEINKATGNIDIGRSQGEKIYNAVEVNPSFPGGDIAFAAFLKRNIIYPSEAKQRNVQGRVFIQFVVETDGSLTDLKILRDPGAGLGAEAIRVLKLSPYWIPGKQNGKQVRVQFIVPINFTR